LVITLGLTSGTCAVAEPYAKNMQIMKALLNVLIGHLVSIGHALASLFILSSRFFR
jgi:hypothetical protein